VTANPFIKRLLGEGADEQAAVELNAPQETMPPPDSPAPEEDQQQQQEQSVDPTAVPATQELVQMWQRGERMGVAARLMFTQASYADFVDLVFQLGQPAGRELGGLLDELADTEGIEPPQTPPQYSDLLNRVAGANEEEGVL